ncbi:MAG TPA: glycosyltransferase [Gemmatimonadales bacterium]|nr:glycosyltransferase [Gemmatimonadales bacterium]
MPAFTPRPAEAGRLLRISVIIPARNEAQHIGAVVASVLRQQPAGAELEVIVVDDGSTDSTAATARGAGAQVLELGGSDGNPAAARNRGAAAARGDLLVFLDSDCTPDPGWLDALVAAHQRGAVIVGGALDLPAGLSASARCDYYCGWYHVHSRRRPGAVSNHPPGNLSIRREAFAATSGFVERQPIAYAHEELVLQAELRKAGAPVWFEPAAIVRHRNRPGFGNLLRRNYRWGYSALETKAETGAARAAWLYRHPYLLLAASAPLAPVQAAYIIGCWLRAGIWEPLLFAPVVLAARAAYTAGFIAGGIRWLRGRRAPAAAYRPRWE